ncbi:IDS-type sesquiterpene synthase [Halyomorpha halys]|uniref:IDS-type sesquiterpene synthase n=1 Tax=Halyomorpha halys TaxID=286706 RepID=UPI0006D4DF7C|nr:farnesyl pyrophosphate synthase 2-like [Halyomorpha halys]
MASKVSANLSGVLLRIVQKKKNVYVRHKLDTEIDQYYQTLLNVVIPGCMESVKEIPGFSQRMKYCISYTTPSYFDGCNFSTELIYRTVAEKHHQTEENIEKSRILRALMEMCFAMIALVDDIVDKGEVRCGKKIWSSICEGGQEAAFYDSYTVNYLITCMLQRHFRNDPGYSRMLELFAMVNGSAAIGQTLDILDRKNFDYNDVIWKHTVENKAMKPVCAASGLGLLHAGIICDDLLYKTMNVFAYYGLLFQVWDDFMEYYSLKEQSGKDAPDSESNVNSWATVTAMAHFNAAQAKEFKACYGSGDPAKRSRVCELFDEVDLPGKYVEYLMNTRMTIAKKIRQIPDVRIRSACTSYMEWLLGEADYDVQLERLESF